MANVFLDSLDGVLERGLKVYSTLASGSNQREETGVQATIAQAQLERERTAAEAARASAAASIANSQTLMKVALYGSVALVIVTVGGYLFKPKRGK